jgi:1,4-dihydroxy-2-naphtoate prenyltransferase (EC 2.5.1.-)
LDWLLWWEFILFFRGGWPIVIIGILSIASGILYTGGPWPLGYLGLGDLFVLIFFGPVAVAGTFYVQTLEITPVVIFAGLGPGLLATALLAVNNLRDEPTDKKVGKLTLAVRFWHHLRSSRISGSPCVFSCDSFHF